MHDGGGNRDQDVQALPTIIETFQNAGYQFVTMNEMLQACGFPEWVYAGVVVPVPRGRHRARRVGDAHLHRILVVGVTTASTLRSCSPSSSARVPSPSSCPPKQTPQASAPKPRTRQIGVVVAAAVAEPPSRPVRNASPGTTMTSISAGGTAGRSAGREPSTQAGMLQKRGNASSRGSAPVGGNAPDAGSPSSDRVPAAGRAAARRRSLQPARAAPLGRTPCAGLAAEQGKTRRAGDWAARRARRPGPARRARCRTRGRAPRCVRRASRAGRAACGTRPPAGAAARRPASRRAARACGPSGAPCPKRRGRRRGPRPPGRPGCWGYLPLPPSSFSPPPPHPRYTPSACIANITTREHAHQARWSPQVSTFHSFGRSRWRPHRLLVVDDEHEEHEQHRQQHAADDLRRRS